MQDKATLLAQYGMTNEAKEAYSKAKLLGLGLAAPDNVTTGPYKVSFDIGLKKSDYNVIIKESQAVEGLSGDKWTEYYVNIADKTGSNHLATIVIKSLEASIPINTGSDWAKILNSIDSDDPRVPGLRTYSRSIDGTDGGIASFTAEMDSGLVIDGFRVNYQPVFDPTHTIVEIVSTYPWDAGTLSLLKTIHVENINATS